VLNATLKQACSYLICGCCRFRWRNQKPRQRSLALHSIATTTAESDSENEVFSEIANTERQHEIMLQEIAEQLESRLDVKEFEPDLHYCSPDEVQDKLESLHTKAIEFWKLRNTLERQKSTLLAKQANVKVMYDADVR
jgi:hypothetical protein